MIDFEIGSSHKYRQISVSANFEFRISGSGGKSDITGPRLQTEDLGGSMGVRKL